VPKIGHRKSAYRIELLEIARRGNRLSIKCGDCLFLAIGLCNLINVSATIAICWEGRIIMGDAAGAGLN
jgi:hypothetical protein